jgi:hypothetical protein
MKKEEINITSPVNDCRLNSPGPPRADKTHIISSQENISIPA